MKKQLLLFVMILLPLVASAYDIAVKNADDVTIYYNYINNGTELRVTYNNNITNCYSGSVVIPEEATYMNRTRKVTSIGGSAFANCSGLTSVTIPNSVTSIEGSAFQDCSGLTSVTIPNSVMSIGYKAFYNCSNLRTFTIPNNVTSIGESALQNCSGLYSITIPNSVTSIGNKAFYGCDLSEVISDIENPFYINTNTFFDNISYNATLYIPKGTVDKYHAAGGGWSKFGKTEVAYYDIAIENADGVTIYYNYINDKKELEVTYKIHPEHTNFRSYSDAVVIPEEVTYMDKTLKVTSIGYLAFCNCSRLTSITISNSVTSIGIEAFRTCQRLRYVHISDLESWCKIAFSRASSNPLCYAHHLFLNGEEIKDLVIPNSVTSIGDYAFYGCSGLTSVTIPNSVTSIGRNAFYDCDIPTVISLIVNPFAIYGSSSSSRSFSEITFYNATLYVPAGTIDTYKSTEGWKDFLFIEEGTGGGETPTPQQCEKPTISYQQGKLTFASATQGATCQYSITDTDIKAGSGNEVQLTATYNISVYATKVGFYNSETAEATLCWIDVAPKTEGITDGIANVPANAVLIKSIGGQLTIEGANDGERISVYSINGTQAGSAISQNGQAVVGTNLQPGSVAIVKIGEKSVKVVVK